MDWKQADIRTAYEQGYDIVLFADGLADVIKPDGTTYHVSIFDGCDCPDKWMRGGSYEGHCKHEHWVAQMTPCPICTSRMIIADRLDLYECQNPRCRNARDRRLVAEDRKAERRARRAHARRAA